MSGTLANCGKGKIRRAEPAGRVKLKWGSPDGYTETVENLSSRAIVAHFGKLRDQFKHISTGRPAVLATLVAGYHQFGVNTTCPMNP